MNEILLDQLKHNKFFYNVNEDDILKLDESFFEKRIYQAGVNIVEEGKPSEEMYLIVSGTVQIYKALENGKTINIITRGPTDFIGEMGLIENKPRSSGVISQNLLEVLVIKKEHFLTILSLIPQTNINLTRTITARLRESDLRTSSEIIRYEILLDLNKQIVIQKKELERLNRELIDKNRELYQMTITDQLTGIYNRSFMMENLSKELLASLNSKKTFSCMMIDIDNFKSFNDNYGHLVGDFIIKETASLISQTIRRDDFVFRFGGEEFLVLLPKTETKEAYLLADNIRKKVETNNFSYKDKFNLSVTISIGIADNKIGNITSEDQIIHHTDEALYEAKRNGKNQTIISNYR
ncbi:MAG: GGDEF domain-containing protein [Leptospiraceae bacterium]|nr:GGDEF domain-containing protein [Leptospiraceae bacterium]MCP5496008.1 GGDEF domain-containing protein [Leptospiraceae bacterium]